MNKLIINNKIYNNICCRNVPGGILLNNEKDDFKLSIILDYNRKQIDSLSVGEEKKIELNEIILSGYDESENYSKLYSLINPKISFIKKLGENKYSIYFICNDKNSIVHMHEFYEIHYIEVEITFDYILL